MKKTNQTFHLPRFLQYARAHFSEKKRVYFWFFAIIAMIYFMILLMMLADGRPKYTQDVQMFFYYAGLLSTGTVFALRYHANLARTQSALLYLMQPASTSEKWLLATCITLVMYPIIYTLLYTIMTLPVTWINQALYLNSPKHYREIENFHLFLPLTSFKIYNTVTTLSQLPIWIIYLSLVAFSLTTSVFFKKLPLIKSISLGFCVFLFCLLLFIVSDSEAILGWFDNDWNMTIGLHIACTLVWIVTPIAMLMASFFALKERDLS